MSMSDRDGFIWYDGELVPWRNATTHVLTHSLHYGLAVFEGVRAYDTEIGTAIFRLKDVVMTPGAASCGSDTGSASCCSARCPGGARC